MIGSLFDSPWKILIVTVVLIVLFGSKKPTRPARLGKSMRILKTEVSSLHERRSGTAARPAPVARPAGRGVMRVALCTADVHSATRIRRLRRRPVACGL